MTISNEVSATSKRQSLMSICAHASASELQSGLDAIAPAPAVAMLREPEIGMVMLRGRMGGDGAEFNLGEATVSRSVVRLVTGETGFSYILGRDPERARLAAIVDAVGQREPERAQLETSLVAPVRARLAQAVDTQRQRTAATRVNFFTLVRGED